MRVVRQGDGHKSPKANEVGAAIGEAPAGVFYVKVFFIGAKCHARILHRILVSKPLGMLHQFPLVYDADPATTRPWGSCELYHDLELALWEAQRLCDHFVVAIGSNGKRRAELSEQIVKRGLEPVSIIHHTVHIGEETRMGHGAQILTNVNVGDEVTVGDWCLFHSDSLVEHESVVGHGVSVMAGAVVCGKVRLGNYCTIGANATVLPGLTIGEGSIVGAAAVVTRDVRDNMIVVGNPARRYWPRVQGLRA